MAQNQKEIDFNESIIQNLNIRIKDLEEKQKMLRDRLILLGENLIEIKEKTNSDIIEIKKNIEIMKESIEKVISFLEIATSEFQKFARKEDLEILSKKIKISQDIETIKKK
jgi:predicted  nucleic acid-binding Zn-ribbon protein